MRFLITIENSEIQQVPINYQYPVSIWINRIFSRAEGTFKEWLDINGYTFSGPSRFSLYNFSGIQFYGSGFKNDPSPSLHVPPGKHQFQLSVFMGNEASAYITELFMNQELYINSKDLRTKFTVTSVEKLSMPKLEETTTFRALSPVVISKPKENASGKLISQYLAPDNEEYGRLLHENILKRYIDATTGKIGQEDPDKPFVRVSDIPFDTSLWEIKVTGSPKARLQTIKAGTPNQSKIKGFVFDFELTAPPELLSFIYATGIGEKGSLGFGFVEIAK
ncbi:MAG: CRISPR-associated endoribonuclease Cas6 [Bacteroidales bacterium]